MFQRFLIVVALLAGFAAGKASAQSSPPPEGDLPPLCDITRFSTSKPSDDESPPDDSCPRDFPGQGTPGPAPAPRPDPFIPDDPPIRRQN